MSTQPKKAPAPYKPPPTREEVAQRWRFWSKIALFTTFGLVMVWLAWAYLWPVLYPRVFPVKLPDEALLEDVVAEFNDDPDAAAKKYINRRIVVEGKLVVEEPTPGKAGGSRVYFQVTDANGDDLEVPVEFFDIDDSGGVEPGDQVALSGVLKRDGPGKFRLTGAGRMGRN